MHPIEDIRASKSSHLQGKRVVLGITGSVAAVESVKLARELARHGAEVIPVMTKASTKIIHPDSIHFATGHRPILELNGAVKHVELCGVSKGRADVLLIAPATANTISKIAHGVDDTSVTTMASCALGSDMPVIIVPAMHTSMYTHNIIKDNIKKLKRLDVLFLGPRMEEAKAKMALIDEVVWAVCRTAGPWDYKGKSVLIVTGASKEPIDDVRCITNYATGRTGVEIALEANRRGADVKIWASESVGIPEFLDCNRFSTVSDLAKMTKNTKADVIVVPAAISDFTVGSKKGKIPSDIALTLELGPAPRILESFRKNKRALIAGFKVETGIDNKELEKRAEKRLDELGLDLMVANLIEDVEDKRTKALILKPGMKTIAFKGSKSELAVTVMSALSRE
jgi:phosphopantothenoylcysteine decarboxylase/phosphopantothenate--cysteine ligase